MSSKTIMEFSGFREMAEKMRELPDKIARNALRSAVSAGAAIIKKSAATKAPVDTGALKASLYQKQIREKSGVMQQTFYVGVRKGITKYANTAANRRAGKAGKAYQNGGKTYYWHMVEFGTSKMPAHPFIRPAFEQNKEAAARAIGEKLDERIQKYANELRLKK